MSEMLTFEGVKAAKCVAYGHHEPHPLRYVWHHILPQTCGGKTEPDNLIEICDNCHYAIHAVMRNLALGKPRPLHASHGAIQWGTEGYNRAVAAGTVGQIPNEGGSE